MMKVLLFSLVLVGAAIAEARPNTTKLTCNQSKALVDAHGAIVLSTGNHTYDRFVSSAASCEYGEDTLPAWVPTADVAQCFIGYVCGANQND